MMLQMELTLSKGVGSGHNSIYYVRIHTHSGARAIRLP